jgi:hypothetical protein
VVGLAGAVVVLVLLSRFHACLSCWGVGVAGWNIMSGSWFCGAFGFCGFGTLLGPEGTPCGVFFLAAPGLDRLTPCVVGVVVVVVGWGVVVC